MTTESFAFAYFGNQLCPAESANVNIASHSLQYGTTCFAGMRGYMRDGVARVFRLEDHHARLMNASKILEMNFHLSFEEFKEIIAQLIAKNRPQTDFYLRPFIFSRDKKLAPKGAGLTFELAVYMVPMGNYFASDKGMRMMISSWRKFSDASLPTKAKAGGCYVNSFLATNEANRCGYDEALLMDHNGYIVEASVANIVLHHHGRVVMPPIGAASLEGITMRTVLDFFKEEQIHVHHENIDRSMVYSCEEMLLTGTAASVAFVDSVDGREIGKTGTDKCGKLCKMLREKFAQVIEMKHPRSKEWIFEFRSKQ